MTNEQIKEAVSYHIVSLLAVTTNIKVLQPPYDNGVDLLFWETKSRQKAGKREFFDSGRIISVQLKCTTWQSIVRTEDSIKYDLKVRNYNQILRNRIQRTKEHAAPLILIVVILNEEVNTWLVEKNNSILEFQNEIYWYVPNKKAVLSENKSKVRINIPTTNKITKKFLSTIFDEKL